MEPENNIREQLELAKRLISIQEGDGLEEYLERAHELASKVIELYELIVERGGLLLLASRLEDN